MLDDIDVMRQMYAIVCGGADDNLTLLENGNVWEARRVLQEALLRAEELYIAAEQAKDDLDEHRKH